MDGWVTANLGSFKTNAIYVFVLKPSYTSEQHTVV